MTKNDEKVMNVSGSKSESKILRKVQDWIYHQLPFVVTIVLIAGICLGLLGGKILYEKKLSESVLIGGFVLDKKVYDVKLRP